MSNENKTALTAEEIAYKYVHGQHDALTENQEKIDMAKDINDLISLQTKDKDKEIEQCKNLANIQQKRWIERNEKLQSTIESQQKEIEELKTSIEGVFGWREKNHHLTISEKQLKSQLSEVTKERDELREGIKTIYENAYYKPHSDSLGEINTICERLITPNKEEREEGKQWICNSCNAPNFTQSVSQDEIDNETLSCISCGGFEFHLK